MTAATTQQRNVQRLHREASTHSFAVGQSVRLKAGIGRTSTEIYQITGKLPPRGNSPQYRIRNDEERHERVTTQDDLEAVVVSQSGPSLVERTFGRGPGAETARSSDGNAQARNVPAKS